jgi:hypothetical protein
MKKENLSFFQILVRDAKLLSLYLVYSVIFTIYRCIKNPSLIIFLANVGNTCTFFGIHALWFLSSLWISKILIRLIDSFDSKFFKFALIFAIYVLSYFVSRFLLKLNYAGVVGQFVKSLSWSIVRIGVISIFVYFGYFFKKQIFQFIKFFRSHNFFCLAEIFVAGSILIPFVKFEAVDYHLLKNGLFLFDIFYGIAGTLFVLGISVVIVRFPLKFLSNFFIGIGKNSVHYMASEYFGFSTFVFLNLQKFSGGFHGIWYASFLIYFVILYFAIRFLAPVLNKIIGFLTIFLSPR